MLSLSVQKRGWRTDARNRHKFQSRDGKQAGENQDHGRKGDLEIRTFKD